VVCEVPVGGRDLLVEWLSTLKLAFGVQAPHLPVVDATSAKFIVIFGVESNFVQLLIECLLNGVTEMFELRYVLTAVVLSVLTFALLILQIETENSVLVVVRQQQSQIVVFVVLIAESHLNYALGLRGAFYHEFILLFAKDVFFHNLLRLIACSVLEVYCMSCWFEV